MAYQGCIVTGAKLSRLCSLPSRSISSFDAIRPDFCKVKDRGAIFIVQPRAN